MMGRSKPRPEMTTEYYAADLLKKEYKGSCVPPIVRRSYTPVLLRLL
jgi:hypothetical protein